MGLKKLVDVGGLCVHVAYEWYDYILLPFRLVVFILLLLMVWLATIVVQSLDWLANQPKLQPFDRRGRRKNG